MGEILITVGVIIAGTLVLNGIRQWWVSRAWKRHQRDYDRRE